MLKNQLGAFARTWANFHVPGSKPDIMLLSTPRSGSTWLMETVVAERGIRPCNEPFNLRKPEVVARLGIESWEELCSLEARIKIERYLCAYSTNQPGYRFKNLRPFESGYNLFTNRVLFKVLFCLEDSIDWIKHSLNMQVVVLIRHPIPVSLSREALPRLSSLIDSTVFHALSADQQRYSRNIYESGSWREKAVLDWTLQNLPLVAATDSADLFVTYEQMVMEPEVIVDRLIATLDLDCEQSVRANVDRPSRSVSKSSQAQAELLRSADKSKAELVDRWVARLSDDERSRLMEIPERLGLSVYPTRGVLPSKDYWISTERFPSQYHSLQQEMGS
ncbi:MAG: hypothetical protein AAGI88_10435 [Pseudomonadota bacterium]